MTIPLAQSPPPQQVYYFRSTTNFNDREMATSAEKLPPTRGKKFLSTYDRIFGKGLQKGA
jgi:hypothetical protein